MRRKAEARRGTSARIGISKAAMKLARCYAAYQLESRCRARSLRNRRLDRAALARGKDHLDEITVRSEQSLHEVHRALLRVGQHAHLAGGCGQVFAGQLEDRVA